MPSKGLRKAAQRRLSGATRACEGYPHGSGAGPLTRCLSPFWLRHVAGNPSRVVEHDDLRDFTRDHLHREVAINEETNGLTWRTDPNFARICHRPRTRHETTDADSDTGGRTAAARAATLSGKLRGDLASAAHTHRIPDPQDVGSAARQEIAALDILRVAIIFGAPYDSVTKRSKIAPSNE